MTPTPDEAVNLDAAVERLEASAYLIRRNVADPEEWRCVRPAVALDFIGREGWETIPLVRLSDAEAALSASNARAVAAEEALRDLVSWFDGKPVNGPVWIIRAGERGVDDAVEHARTTLASMKGADHD